MGDAVFENWVELIAGYRHFRRYVHCHFQPENIWILAEIETPKSKAL